MRRPKVLFLGNGINVAFNGGNKLDTLLDNVNINNIKIADDDKKIIPFPLRALAMLGVNPEKHLKSDDENLFGSITNEYYDFMSRLLENDFDYIITTNYSYEVEKYLINNKNVKDFKRYNKTLSGVKNDHTYIINTYKEIIKDEKAFKIFHIHGEINKPKSVILTHNNYVNLLSHITTTTKKIYQDIIPMKKLIKK